MCVLNCLWCYLCTLTPRSTLNLSLLLNPIKKSDVWLHILGFIKPSNMVPVSEEEEEEESRRRDAFFHLGPAAEERKSSFNECKALLEQGQVSRFSHATVSSVLLLTAAMLLCCCCCYAAAAMLCASTCYSRTPATPSTLKLAIIFCIHENKGIGGARV